MLWRAELPPLLTLGTSDQGLLQRLVDGGQRHEHDLFVDHTMQSPASGYTHLPAPQAANQGRHCPLRGTALQLDALTVHSPVQNQRPA
jgi:hypothetical protein